jgi:phosphoglycolate phosphatase
LLELKKAGFRLGILTSNSKENVQSFLMNNQLDIFDSIYSGASVFGKSKVIKTAIKKGKFSSHEVVYVGDETRDVDAARSAGVRIISVSWGFNTKEVLQKQNPDFLIDHPSELPALLE